MEGWRDGGMEGWSGGVVEWWSGVPLYFFRSSEQSRETPNV
jgi:hypothetical protein